MRHWRQLSTNTALPLKQSGYYIHYCNNHTLLGSPVIPSIPCAIISFHTFSQMFHCGTSLRPLFQSAVRGKNEILPDLGGGIFSVYPKGTRGLTSPKEGVILETARSCLSRTRYARGCQRRAVFRRCRPGQRQLRVTANCFTVGRPPEGLAGTVRHLK